MKTVLVNRPIHAKAIDRLAQEVNVLMPFTAPSAQVFDMLPGLDGFLLCAGFDFDIAAFDCAANLKVLGRHGVGLDNVDLDAATAYGVPVVYTPFGPTESTAEHALTLMLATARHLARMDSATRAGNFVIRNRLEECGHEMRGKALGVVGFGRIGRRLAEMCRDALQMVVYVYDPFLPSEQIAAWGASPVESLLALAGMVDVLSLHVPLTPDTHHLIDGAVLAAMKPEAILISIARGAVVDEEALVKVLRERRIFGAGIDVYDPEPPRPDSPLFQLGNTVLTPHVASFTEEARELMGLTVAEDILRVLRGEKPEYLANPEVWKGRD
ncbi:MAG: hydroxyacid dehydrogenase [Anaerolineae bacterium]|nr:hydroxyacid dehydrogenase [Anaerolineae bacterium]